MDYEKKYKEALEWARKVMQGKVGFVLDEVLEKFPELKESEDERIIHWIRKELEAKYVVDNIVNNVIADKALAWLEKQKPEVIKDALRTEYEKGRADAIEILEKRGEISIEIVAKELTKDKESAIKFLKSAGIMNENGELAEEYVADTIEQKTAWSEEDELMLTSIIQTLKLTNGAAQMKIDWLKLLKERHTWKPTEEQIQALEYHISSTFEGTWQYKATKELLEQLKKL